MPFLPPNQQCQSTEVQVEWHQLIQMTLNELEDNFVEHLLTAICLRMNQEVHVACNFNCLIETEGLLKVTGSCVY